MASPQTLSPAERRIVASWAAACAERVLPLCEAEAPGDGRFRDAVARARAFSRGELDAAPEIRHRFAAFRAVRAVTSPAARAAARAAAHAAAVAHMGAHALGAAAYAVRAAELAAPSQPTSRRDEIEWQIAHMAPQVRAALSRLPPVGEDRAGPLGPGLLSSGVLADTIREIQSAVTAR